MAHDLLDELYTQKKLPLYELPPLKLYPNQYLIVQNGSGESGSALTRVKDDHVVLLNLKALDTATAIKPRNKEQYFAMDALTDPTLRVVTLTGVAGSGKSLCTLAAAIASLEQKKYKKLILTKPMSQVGKRDLGILPGTLSEKFMPFLINYACNLEVIFGGGAQRSSHKMDLELIFHKYNIELVPLQLMRGASFNDSLVVADEIQILDSHEMLTLGTRMSEGSKLIIMGDLNQRDERIEKTETGLFKFLNDEQTKSSTIAAHLHLLKCERGAVSELFTKVFPDP